MSGTGSPTSLQVAYAASEVTPFAKTGGLADVVGSLPRAMAKLGHQCLVLLPLYRSARQTSCPLEATAHEFEVPIAAKRVRGRLWRSRLPNSDVPVYLIEQAGYYERDDPDQGRGIYQYRLPTGRNRDYPDNAERFIFFSRAVLEALTRLGFTPDVLHCNDWQTGLIPVYVRELYRDRELFKRTKSLLTIHNVAYQGVFWHWDMTLTGLDWSLFNWRQLEFYGHLNFLKSGVVFAEAINTVSPRYAEEIQTEEFGCGMEDVLRYYRGKLFGIVNGIDPEVWNPATDAALAATYNKESVTAGKAACKAALRQRLRLPDPPGVPLLAMISRLVEQKGLDLLRAAANEILREKVQLVVLGVGDAGYQHFLQGLQKSNPDQVAAVFEFNEQLAHQIEGGADIFLMPSRFEPSGLNQLYSLRYGTVPVVREVGGLSDTVTDATPETIANGTATGFTFRPYAASVFLDAIRRALTCYRQHPDQWLRTQQTGMDQDWSWNRSAKKYEELYHRLREPNLSEPFTA